jgi:hypothetical protein
MGSFVDVLLSLCMFWSALHACKYLVARLNLAHSSGELIRSRAVLPLDRAPPSRILSLSHHISHKAARIFVRLRLSISLNVASIRVETTVLNASFDKASVQITQATPHSYASKVKYILDHFYSLGAAVGLLGMAFGYMLLVWSCLTVLYSLGPSSGNPHNPEDPTHAEDEPLSSPESFAVGGTGLAVQPIVSSTEATDTKLYQTCSDTRSNSTILASTHPPCGAPR